MSSAVGEGRRREGGREGEGSALRSEFFMFNVQDELCSRWVAQSTARVSGVRTSVYLDVSMATPAPMHVESFTVTVQGPAPDTETAIPRGTSAQLPRMLSWWIRCTFAIAKRETSSAERFNATVWCVYTSPRALKASF